MLKLCSLAILLVLYPVSNVRAQLPGNAGAHYSFEVVDPPGVPADSVYALGINDLDIIAGYYRTNSNCYAPGDTCDVGYLKDGANYHSILLGTAGYTFLSGTNDAGISVGTCCGSNSAHGPGVAYSGRDGAFHLIFAPGAQATFLTSISNLGVIGGYSEAPGNLTSGFLLQDGTFTQIVYPGAAGTYVYGVNSSGQAVGNAVMGTSAQAFLYQDGAFQLIQYPGAASTAANGINDAGIIVGSYTLPGSTISYGFIYHGGVFSPFDQPDCKGTIPQGVNNYGAIVGEDCSGAFIATPDSQAAGH